MTDTELSELSRAVAQRIMGEQPKLEWLVEVPGRNTESFRVEAIARLAARELGGTVHATLPSPYATDLAAAFRVVERLASQHRFIEILAIDCESRCGFAVKLFNSSCLEHLARSIADLPAAICRLALRTLEVHHG